MSDQVSPRDLGEALRAGRAAAELSLRELEAQSGVPKSAISRLENGDRGAANPSVLARLAQALELRTADLFLLAEIPLPQDLPTLPAMLRAEYGLSAEAIAEVQRSIDRIARKHAPRSATRPINKRKEG